MPKAELTVPDHLDMRISQLVEQGEFLDREEAIQELLSAGLTAYRTGGKRGEEPDFAVDATMGHEDEYAF